MNKFDIELVNNPLSLRNSIVEKNDIVIKNNNELRDKVYNGQIYKFKEQILMNNLPIEYIQNNKIECLNNFYYENYYKFYKDFETESFEHLMKMREKYLKKFIEVKEVENEKKENAENEQKKKDEFESSLLMLFDNLYNILKIVNNEPNEINIRNSIIIVLLNDILLEVSNESFPLKFFEEYNEIEIIFDRIIDEYIKNFLDNKDKIEDFSMKIFHKFQEISLYFKSTPIFLKLLQILKKYNICLGNYKTLYKQHFKDKFKITNLIQFTKLNEKIIQNFTYDIVFCEMTADSDFLYLCINCDIIKFKILKINLQNEKIFLDKLISEELTTKRNMIKLLINNKTEELIIFSILKETKKVNLYFYDKNTLTLKNEKEVNIKFDEKETILNLFSSESRFYIYTSLNLYYIDINTEQVIIELNDPQKYFEKIYNNYFFISNEYILFQITKNTFKVYNVIKKKVTSIQIEYSNFFSMKENNHYNSNKDNKEIKEINKYYYDIKNNCLFKMITNEKNDCIIEKKTNLSLAFAENENIVCVDEINKKIITNYNKLEQIKEHFKKESNEESDSPSFLFKDYLQNYKNDIHSICEEQKKIKYIVDPILCQNYIDFFYFLLIKYFVYFGDKSIITNKDFYLNITNDLLFNIIKKKILEEKENKNINLYFLKLILNLFVNYSKIYDNSKKNKGNINEIYKEIQELFQYCTQHFSENQLYLDIIQILSKNSNCQLISNELFNELKQKLTQKDISFDLKIVYFNILISKGYYEKDFLNIFFETEREMILSHQKKDKIDYLAQKSFINLKRFFIDIFSRSIFEIDLNELNNPNNLFSILKEHFIIVINQLKESKINSLMLFNNSTICKLFLLTLNVIYIKAKKENFDISSYIKILETPLLQLENLPEKEKEKDIEKTEEIILETDHPIINEKSIIYNFSMLSKENSLENINIIFDGNSYLNESSQIKINNLGPYNTNIPTNVMKIDSKISATVQLEYKKEKNSDYGIKLKISNQTLLNENDNIFVTIRRTIIYTICDLLYSKIKKYENEEEFDKFNKFFEKILVFKYLKVDDKPNFDYFNSNEPDKKIIKFEQFLDEKKKKVEKSDNDILNNIEKDEYKNIFNKIFSSSKNLKEIDEHKQKFLKIIFKIILKKNNLFKGFEKFIKEENEENTLFKTIYENIHYSLQTMENKKPKDDIENILKFIDSIILIEEKTEEDINKINSDINYIMDLINKNNLNVNKIIENVNKNDDILVQKRKSLSILNQMFPHLKKSQDIKDIIYFYNKIIKGKEDSFLSINKILSGSDISIVHVLKKEIYKFIFLVCEKIYSKKILYDLDTNIKLLQSLIWDFNFEDFEILKNSRLIELFTHFDIFVCDILTKYNNAFNKDIDDMFYNTYKISMRKLYLEIFNVFSLLSLTIFKEFIKDNNEINKFYAEKIYNVINEVIHSYLGKIKDYINKPCPLMNEEKFNSFLLILFKGMNENENLINLILEKNKNILSDLLEIVILSSERNKYVSLKIIKNIIFNEKVLDSMKVLVSSLRENCTKFYYFIYDKDINKLPNHQILFQFLIKYSILLQQNKNLVSHYIIVSQSDLNISFELINLCRYIISNKNDSTIKKELIKFIEENINQEDYLLTFLLILGIDVDNLGIGSKIKHNNQNGIIIGFSELAKQIFNFSKNKSDDDLYGKFENFLYSNAEYSYIILEKDIKDSQFKSLNFDIILLKTKKIDLLIENKIILTNQKILKSLLGNLIKFNLKNQYLILRYFKNILSEKNIDSLIIKKTKEFYDYIKNNSLNEEYLQMKCRLIKMEKIEKQILEDILKFNKLSKQLEIIEELTKKEKQNKSCEKKNNEESEESNEELILIGENSFYLKYNEGNLIKEYSYLKVYNYNWFQVSNKYLPISRVVNEENTKPFILILENVDEFITIFNKNVKYIITGSNFNPEGKSTSIKNIPIITIDTYELKNLVNFIFDKIPSEDFEDLFSQGTKDFSALIYIPDDMVSEIYNLNPREQILKILGESNDNQQGFKLATNEKNLSIISEININVLYCKLISLISRRLFLVLTEQKIDKNNIQFIKKVVKLLYFESNNLENDDNDEIQNIIKNFFKYICSNSNEENKDLLRDFLDYSFLSNTTNNINFSIIPTIESENELVKFDNDEIGLLLITQILKLSEKSKSIIDGEYKIKLFEVLLNKLLNPKQNIKDFIFSIMINLLNDIKNNIDENIEIFKNFKYIFESKDLLTMIEKENANLEKIEPTPLNRDNKEIVINDIDLKLIELTFDYFDLIFKILSKFEIDISKYLEMKIMKFFLYNTLSKTDFKDIDFHIFILFLYQQGLIKQFTDNELYKPHKTISLNYYDNKYYLPFIKAYNEIIPSETYNNCKGLFLTLKKLDKEIISPYTNVFLYNNSECDSIQDYIKENDKIDIKTIYITQNKISISFPYTQFHTNLFGCGSNEKQSLGCGGEEDQHYQTPQECLGLEDCKNIIDFKFGYYHTFVQSSDNNIFTCGNDQGSSFKEPGEYSYFNLNTHFQDISQKEGGAKGIWVNNYNASILLTQENNLYGCGMNYEYCLTNAIGNQSVSIPFKLPEIKLKVKEISCGFKSSFFLLEDGSAYTCGSNSFHQCGSKVDVNSYQTYFHLIPPKGGKFTKVISGEEFFLVLIDENDKIKNRLYSFGSHENGRTGVGLDSSCSLQKVKNVENLEFKVISSRNDNSAAISKDGELYVFGINESGCLGLGNRENQYIAKRVKSLKNYICDDVGISHNHMIMVSRSKLDGKRYYFSCGTTEHKALALNQFEDNNNNRIFEIPTEITFFDNEKPDDFPMRVSVSRYQSYFMTMNCQLKKQLKKEMEVTCKKCNNKISGNALFDFDIDSKLNYYCYQCFQNNDKSCFYCTNTVYEKINYVLKNLNEKNKGYYIEKSNFIKGKKCLECKKDIKNIIFISTDNNDLILCEKCYNNKSYLIEYPQIFYACKNCFPVFKKDNDISKIIYNNTKKSNNPYLEFDVTLNYKKSYELSQLLNDKQLKDLYENNWVKLKDEYLHELNLLIKDFEEGKLNNKLTEEEVNDKSNLSLYCNKMKLFSILQRLKEDKIEEIGFPNLLNLSENDFHLLFEMNEIRTQSILYNTAISKNICNSYSGIK